VLRVACCVCVLCLRGVLRGAACCVLRVACWMRVLMFSACDYSEIVVC
jgi:hypothetical protein